MHTACAPCADVHKEMKERRTTRIKQYEIELHSGPSFPVGHLSGGFRNY